jgi:PAS domain S-box-containing protein
VSDNNSIDNPTVKPSVLHIDDDYFALELFSLKYRKWFEITSADNSQKVFDLLDNNHFDVIITDYDMPEIDGLALLQIINEKYAGTPVIFFTGQGNEKIAREAFLLGAFDYFVKDFQAFAQTEKIIYAVKRAIAHKKSAQALVEKDQRYSELLEIIPQIIIFADTDGKIKQANMHFETVTGNIRDKFTGISIENLFHEDDRTKIKDIFKNMSETGFSKPGEVRIQTKSGGYEKLTLTVKSLSSKEDGKEILFILQPSEKEELPAASPKPPAIAKAEVREKQSKDKTVSNAGQPPASFTASPARGLKTNGESAKGTALKIAFIYAIVGCLWILTSDSLLSILFQDPLVLSSAQTFKGWFYVGVTAWLLFLLINSNLKKVYETKEILAKTEAANRAILNSIPDPILKISKDGIILDARDSSGFKDFSSMGGGIIGREFAQVIPEAARHGRLIIEKARKKNEPEFFEFRISSETGENKDFEVRVIPGSNNEAILIIREITLRKELETRIIEQNKTLSEFAGSITNRLKTPIGIIGGFTSIIREQRELFDKYYDAIVSEVEKINDMVNNLLRLSSKENAKDKRIRINLRNLVSEVISDVTSEDCIIKVISEKQNPEITAEPESLKQAMKGILSFAFFHRKNPEKEFAIEAAYIETCGAVSVVINFETKNLTSVYLEKLFDPSFSIQKGEMEFGLVLARSAIEIQGGKMNIKLSDETGRLTVRFDFDQQD